MRSRSLLEVLNEILDTTGAAMIKAEVCPKHYAIDSTKKLVPRPSSHIRVMNGHAPIWRRAKEVDACPTINLALTAMKAEEPRGSDMLLAREPSVDNRQQAEALIPGAPDRVKELLAVAYSNVHPTWTPPPPPGPPPDMMVETPDKREEPGEQRRAHVDARLRHIVGGTKIRKLVHGSSEPLHEALSGSVGGRITEDDKKAMEFLIPAVKPPPPPGPPPIKESKLGYRTGNRPVLDWLNSPTARAHMAICAVADQVERPNVRLSVRRKQVPAPSVVTEPEEISMWDVPAEPEPQAAATAESMELDDDYAQRDEQERTRERLLQATSEALQASAVTATDADEWSHARVCCWKCNTQTFAQEQSRMCKICGSVDIGVSTFHASPQYDPALLVVHGCLDQHEL